MLGQLNLSIGAWLRHPGLPLTPDGLWRAWNWEPWVVASLLAVTVVYSLGITRLWRRGGPGAGVRVWQVSAFAAGILALAVALLSPLSALGGVLFSAHMTQHTVLMLAAAPLLILGAPVVGLLWGLPKSWRVQLGRLARQPALRGIWRAVTRPAMAWLIHAIVLWVWHLPSLYQSTLHSDLIHTVQHASFLGSALLFWWVVMPQGRLSRSIPGYGVLLVFTTALHSSVLGALLTVAPVPWYPAYQPPPQWGLTALEDQQLAGLVMWVPPGVLYLIASLVLFAVWLGRVEARMPARPVRAGVLLLLVVAIGGCTERRGASPPIVAGGNPSRGPAVFRAHGCGTCHAMRGEGSAVGRVGPALDGFAHQVYIAGSIPNKPENLVRWIQSPQSISPLTAMPDLNVPEADARHLAAWLYTRR